MGRFEVCSISSQAVVLFHCLQVDQHSGTTPKRRDIRVPSLASIEEMRTLALENLKEEKNIENRSKLGHNEMKVSQQAASLNRAPFADVN